MSLEQVDKGNKFMPALPEMLVVPKGFMGGEGGVPVSYRLRELIFRMHFDEDREVSQHESRVLNDFLFSVREDSHKWICCRCSPSLSCFTVRRNPNGSHSPMVVKGRTAHDPECPFYRTADDSTEGAHPSMRIPLQYKCGEFIGIHMESLPSSGTGSGKKDGSRSRAGGRKSKLSSLLWTMVNEAKLNVFDVSKFPDFQSQRSSIERFFRELRICHKVNASNYFSFASDFNDLKLLRQRLRNSIDDWGHYRKQGFCLFIARRIEGDTLVGVNGSIKYLREIIRPGMSSTPGPYLAVFSISNSVTGGEFVAQRAFVIPIVSEIHMFPVESHYERKVFGILKWYFTKKDTALSVRIFKPSMDIPIGDEFDRPDFIVEYGSRRVILEVLGFNTEEYLFRKMPKISGWRKRGEKVFEFEAFHHDADSRDFVSVVARICDEIRAELTGD